MKRDALKKVPALKSENGALTGGFSSLSIDQMRKLKGGGNMQCNNKVKCILGSHTQCNNTGTCFSDSDTDLGIE
ncbi:hypothetical protein NZD88_04675 [Chryseobacterium antibioticum]|uniref:Natural product n=1 Tax=Chryseobacterium pyrolae TaxID=2987481 RepID=A0ABT2IDZ0_9FLAO|nr:hypothetical protein [Chryseobacterium pyrolae]MCT2406850.1 hypothetical protein [Chryseobacterium pyrolae]